MKRIFITVALIALPQVLSGQSEPGTQRGCPPPPTGRVPAIPTGAPVLTGALLIPSGNRLFLVSLAR